MFSISQFGYSVFRHTSFLQLSQVGKCKTNTKFHIYEFMDFLYFRIDTIVIRKQAKPFHLDPRSYLINNWVEDDLYRNFPRDSVSKKQSVNFTMRSVSRVDDKLKEKEKNEKCVLSVYWEFECFCDGLIWNECKKYIVSNVCICFEKHMYASE